MRPRWPWAERWRPRELGYSLPIADRLRRWALALAAVGAAAVVLLAVALSLLGRSGTDPADEAFVRQTVLDRLAHVELPVWEPGADLEAVPLPGFAPPPPPPPALERHPGDPPVRQPERLARALSRLDGDEFYDAATDLVAMAERQPASWQLAYDAGLGYLAAELHERAAATLGRAGDRLDAYAPRHAGDPAHHAATIATRYAYARAVGRDDCIAAIRSLKIAVSDLRRFEEAGGGRSLDRRTPYRVEPTGLSSLDVWSALMAAYLDCDAYPAGYFARYRDASGFRASEYDDPAAADVAEGPFPHQLAECIESDGATARCWALSNLNSLYLANRPFLTRGELPRALADLRLPLARLAYNAAHMAASGEDAAAAPDLLLQAYRLKPDDPDLARRIEVLARHLGAEQHNYTVLAERFRGRDAEELGITPQTPNDELKGMAWALREQWQRHLAERRPEAVFADVAAARQVIPDAHLDSLAAWEEGAREALRDALAAEIRAQKKRRNRALAAGLRDFRADYLGGAWAERADAAWWTWELRAARLLLVVLTGLFLLALAAVYRYLVHPYVVHTADAYRLEFERRETAWRALDRPVTGPEMYARERLRRERPG